VLHKPTLRRDGPLLFVEYFRTSYDPTPYLAVDQLAYHAQRFDPTREIERVQIVEHPARIELSRFRKEVAGPWRIVSATLVLDPVQCGDLWSQYRGAVEYGLAKIEMERRLEILSAWNKRGLFCSGGVRPGLTDIATVRLSPEDSLLSAVSREFASYLHDTQPAVVACTGDSKVFSRVRYLMERAPSELAHTLAVIGGIHAIAAHDDTLQHLAEETGLLTPSSQPFDLIHYGPSGEADFTELLRAFDLPDTERLAALAGLPNFSGRVRLPEDQDPWNAAYRTNSSTMRRNADVNRCPSEEQLPTSWGEENPLVRRLKGSWGCQFSCSFCATSRGYSPGDIGQTQAFFDSVLAECSKGRVNPQSVLVYFEDANFAGPYASSVLELAKGYPFKLGVQVRFDCLTDAMLTKIKDGGVGYVFLGLESFDDALRNSVNKQSHVTPERMFQVASSLHAAGIEFLISGIVGLPDESVDAMARTILFARLLAPRVISLELPKVYPGTGLAKEFAGRFGGDSVGMLYSRGDKLLETHQAGQESAGSLLMPHLHEEYAVTIMAEAHTMVQMPLDELRQLGGVGPIAFEPLLPAQYASRPGDLGFYVR
jgi:hypothetical protein